MIDTLFGGRAQVVVGAFAFVISVGFWVLGCFTIPTALALPWNWTPAAFIFHASMFALVVSSWAGIAAALSHRTAERVEAQVADIDKAEHVDVR